MEIEITTPSRLHFTLIDLNASLGRVDGGVGVALEYPRLRITAEKARETRITGASTSVKTRMEAVIKTLGGGVRLRVLEELPGHVGLGSGTQVSLAAAEAVNQLYNLGLTPVELAERTGRGGTSGIGVAAYTRGGFILDGGHRFQDKKSFSPSSASHAPPPPVLFQKEFPDWKLLLVIPEFKGASGSREVGIFQEHCPIPLGEVQAVSHIILLEMLPAIVERDLEALGDSINRIQRVGFKKLEIELQHPRVRGLMEALQEAGALGVGMSSFGPTVYALGWEPEELKKVAEEYLEANGVRGEVFLTEANWGGARIKYR